MDQLKPFKRYINYRNNQLDAYRQRFQGVIDAMEEYLAMKKNILIVTHDSWITRLMDMCLANSTNIIPRHVPETTTLRIDHNADCYFHFPKQECQPKEFMNRDHQSSTAFTKYGSIKYLVH